MEIGALDRRIQFQRANIIDDGYQSRPGPHVAYGSPVWASKTPVSDGERFRADTVARDMTDRFVIRWSDWAAGITSADRLVCDGVSYGIIGRKELGRREGIEITAGRVDDVPN